MSKKDVESAQFDLFRKLMPCFPEGRVLSHEEPDFLIISAGKTIGVELTELHMATPVGVTPRQASEAMRHRIVMRAKEIYEQEDRPAIKCAVLMRNDHIAKQDVESLANAVVDIVIRNMPRQNESTREEFTWTNRDYFPEFFYSVHINRHSISEHNHFLCPAATWVSTLSPQDILRATEPKNRKYGAYRKHCDEAWLLINSDTGKSSTWFEPSELAFSTPISSPFQRILLLRHFAGSLHEIPVAHIQG